MTSNRSQLLVGLAPAFLSLSLVACSGEQLIDSGGVVAPFEPTVEPANCGGPEYEWASMERMGEVTYWEPALDASVTPEAIIALQETAGETLLESVPYGVKAYRIRYITQDRGQEIEVSGMVAFPDTLGEPMEVPTLMWLHPTVGFTDECAPSDAGLEFTIPLMMGASQGYAVVAPDYIGLTGVGGSSDELHPYVVAEPTAIASLDSYRALDNFSEMSGGPRLGVTLDNRLLYWGISEGGFAAMWSDRYQPHYLPEVEPVGVVAVVPPTDLLGLMKRGMTQFGDTSEGLVGVLTTTNPWFGNVGELDAILTDEEPYYLASSVEEIIWNSCEEGFGDLRKIDTLEELFTEEARAAAEAEDWDALEPFSCMMRASTLPGSDIQRVGEQVPTLFIVGENDDLVAGPVAKESARSLCAEGIGLEYLECEGGDHVDSAVDSLYYQWRWIGERFAGEEWADGGSCEIDTLVNCEEL